MTSNLLFYKMETALLLFISKCLLKEKKLSKSIKKKIKLFRIIFIDNGFHTFIT